MVKRAMLGMRGVDWRDSSELIMDFRSHFSAAGDVTGKGTLQRAPFSSLLPPCRQAQAQGVEADEAFGVALVISTAIVFKRGDIFVEQAVRG